MNQLREKILVHIISTIFLDLNTNTRWTAKWQFDSDGTRSKDS